MSVGLSVSDIVNVQVNMAPIAAAVRNFGTLLILGDTPGVIDVSERMRQYTNITGVANDFGTTAPEYAAALLFFGQTPQPSILYIGRWASTATAGLLHGGPLTVAQQALVNFTNTTNGGFSISIDGTVQNITGLNLASSTNLNGVASRVTAKLQAGATCAWNSVYSRFDIISGTTGTSSAVGFATAPGSGTDVRALFNIATGQGGTAVAGIAAEPLVSGVSTLLSMSNDWYGLQTVASVAGSIVNADRLAVAALIEASTVSRVYGITTSDPLTMSAVDTTNIAYQLKALGYKRTFTTYSSTTPHAVSSIFGRAFTVDFTGANTTITLKFKQEPGVVPETLTESQAAALDANNCNVFTYYNNNTAILQQGKMANGFFFDEVHGTDWLQNAVQTAVFNLLYASSTKIPQTDAGVSQIMSVVSQELAQAVTNGLVAPGVWSAPGFGALNTGDTLTKGYYCYAAPVSSQSAADRQARKAPVIQCAIKLAGAIHFSNVIINVNR